MNSTAKAEIMTEPDTPEAGASADDGPELVAPDDKGLWTAGCGDGTGPKGEMQNEMTAFATVFFQQAAPEAARPS